MGAFPPPACVHRRVALASVAGAGGACLSHALLPLGTTPLQQAHGIKAESELLIAVQRDSALPRKRQGLANLLMLVPIPPRATTSATHPPNPPTLRFSAPPAGEDHVTTGATSDLQQATRKARHMVVDCGMSERIGPGGLELRPLLPVPTGLHRLLFTALSHLPCPWHVFTTKSHQNRPSPTTPTCHHIPGAAVAVGQEQSPATRQVVDSEIQTILKGSYTRVVRCACRSSSSKQHWRLASLDPSWQRCGALGSGLLSWRGSALCVPLPTPLAHCSLLRAAAHTSLAHCSLLKEKEAELHALAQALLREETLTQADIKRLLAGSSSSPELPGSGPGGSGLLPAPAAAALAAAPAGAAGVPAPAGAAAADSPGLAASVSDPAAAAAAAPPAAE